MRKFGTTSATASLGRKISVKECNITLRRLTSDLQHDVLPDNELMAKTILVFSDINNFIGCEKYFNEAISSMKVCSEHQLREIADRFQQLIIVKGLTD